ncbi:BETA-CAROTENE 3-HYDROXYLASE 1 CHLOROPLASTIC [Salix purpurea]|uniref:beta-carotene 3-hydroxylase n=1 Tax=Salix purpurea TaxID=77065 RepID=A0A9Q0TJ39_SALPP|nr:BETA-CAROTENE 3-HYDROXYLASE 1 CHLOROPLASTIC [Salix purpurea]
MACTASISMAPSSVTHRFRQSFLLAHKPSSSIISAHFKPKGFENWRKNENLNSCLVVEKRAEDSTEVKDDDEAPPLDDVKVVSRVEERLATKNQRDILTLLLQSCLVLVSLQWLPWLCITEFYGKWRVEWFHCWKCSVHSLSVGAVSDHRPRNVPFEINDVFAIINAVPAIALFSYGLFNEGLLPGPCFGAGLGITVFGMAYMFVHDGLVHRRFQ